MNIKFEVVRPEEGKEKNPQEMLTQSLAELERAALAATQHPDEGLGFVEEREEAERQAREKFEALIVSIKERAAEGVQKNLPLH